MKEKFVFPGGVVLLNSIESMHISGGAEWAENISRFIGYVYQSARDIDWTQSSWFNAPRAQR